MLIDRVDAATAAFQVGCESPSQFSREYSGGTRPSGGETLKKGMAEKSREFTGSELYAKA